MHSIILTKIPEMLRESQYVFLLLVPVICIGALEPPRQLDNYEALIQDVFNIPPNDESPNRHENDNVNPPPDSNNQGSQYPSPLPTTASPFPPAPPPYENNNGPNGPIGVEGNEPNVRGL